MNNNQTTTLLRGPIAIFAIHGGTIEPGTSEIAKAIADEDLSLYIYEGRGEAFHIPSEAFEEPEALKLASSVDTIVSIHGQRDKVNAFVMVGGLAKKLVKKLEKSLKNAGFDIKPPPEDLDGDDLNNICNQGKTDEGVQLEVSRKLREKLMIDKDLMDNFVTAIRQAILPS